MNQLPSEDYLHVLLYYLKKDRVLLKEVYQRLPYCHKKIEYLESAQYPLLDFFYVPTQLVKSIINRGKYIKNVTYRTAAKRMNWEKEVKEHYDFVLEKVNSRKN